MGIKPKILLIEDEVQWASFLAHSIGKKFEVYTLTDITEVVDFLEKKISFDVVLLDITIAYSHRRKRGKDAIFMFQYLKEFRPELPIIGYTGYPLNDENLFMKEFGISMILNRRDMSSFEYLINSIFSVIQNSKIPEVEVDEGKKDINVLKNLLNNEIAKFSEIKERTLSIPNEGNFEIIKPLIGFKKDIENQLLKFDYSKNVFLMMKFRKQNVDLSTYILETLKENGLNGIRADLTEWNITKNIYNPIAALYCCKFGIALFDEPEENQAYSPNVAYELGIMHYQDKNCLILKHNSLPSIPFDLIKDIYVQYEKDLQTKPIISNWIKQLY